MTECEATRGQAEQASNGSPLEFAASYADGTAPPAPDVADRPGGVEQPWPRERDRLLDQLRRTRTEFEEYQRRARREREEDARYRHGPVVLDFLAVLDNLERATTAASQAGDTGPLTRGVELVRTMFLDVLRRHGVTRIEALERPFDPDLHNAVTLATDTGRPAGTVVEVLKQGYRIHDRLLRPADVVVAAPPDADP